MESHSQYDVFISYRRELGFSTAMMVRDRLQEKGLRCFLDLKELRSGIFAPEILTSIRQTANFILVLPPNALDRCVNKDDWLALEVLTAMECGRNIIPLLCDGYEWPTDWDPRLPKQLSQLPGYNSVFLSPHYLDATIDRLVEYMKELPFPVFHPDQRAVFQSGDPVSFFGSMMNQKGFAGLDMAFHAGAAWHTNIERLDILTTIAERGIPVRILVNTPEAAEVIAQHMRHRRKRYMSFTDTISNWREFADSFDGNVQIRVSDIPILHIYYAFRMEPAEQSLVWTKYYTYGNVQIEKNYMQVFFAASEYFKLYQAEFEFLWNGAE